MSLSETGGKVATSVIEQFKTQPLCLALLIMNAALLFFIFYNEGQYNTRAREVQELLKTVITRCTVQQGAFGQ